MAEFCCRPLFRVADQPVITLRQIGKPQISPLGSAPVEMTKKA
jgi:hypothetical protein